MALDYKALKEKHRKRDAENWEREKASQKIKSPSDTGSGSVGTPKAAAESSRTYVDPMEIEARSVNANKRMTGEVNMKADAEAAALAIKMQNNTPNDNEKLVKEYATRSVGTDAANITLRNQRAASSKEWEKEKAKYNAEQAEEKKHRVNTPSREKYAIMSDAELEENRKQTIKEYAEHKKNSPSTTSQLFGLIGATAKGEKYQGDTKGYYLRGEKNAASAETTERYKNKFYSLSNDEINLVATVNSTDETDERHINAVNELKKDGYTDNDIKAFTYFYNRYANEQRAKKEDVNARLAMNEHPFLESVVSVPLGLAGGVASGAGIVDSYAENKRIEKELGITDQGLDPYHSASRWQRQAQSGRAEFTDTHDLMIGEYDAGDMLYNTALSGLESAAAASIPGGAIVLGVNAGTAKANELSQRGLSSKQAIMGGVAAGTFETLFETLSIGNIKAFKETDTRTIKDVALNISKSMGVNFTEEMATEVANIIYDGIAHGDKSERAMHIDTLVASGKYTKDEAEKEVFKGQILQIIEAGVSGALMGAAFGATGSAMSFGQYSDVMTKTGDVVKLNDATSAVIAEGLAAPDESDSQKLAQKLSKEVSDGKKVSSFKLGQLAEENAKYGRAVTEGTFAGISSTEELDDRYERQKYIEGTNQNRSQEASRRAMNRLYDEYQTERERLSKFGNKDDVSRMKAAFDDKLHKELADINSKEAVNPVIETENGETRVEGEVFRDKDGDNAIKTEDGKEIKTSELISQIQDKTVSRLYEKIPELSAEAANVFLKNYNGETVAEYGRAFDYYYQMGRTGMNISDIRKNDNIYRNYLSEKAQAQIANAGLRDRDFRKGFTDLSAGRKNERYRYESKVLEYIGEKRNLEIFVIDEDSEINGSYISGTNRIVIRRNAEGKLLLRTAGHEAFHFIKNQVTDDAGKAEVKALEDFVLDALNKNGEDIEAEIERLGAITDSEGSSVYQSREDCIEEIVANSMFEVFTNEKFTQKMFDENPSVFRKIAKKVKQILADIKYAVKLLGNSDSAIRALKDDTETLKKINSMFDSLLEKAGESYEAENAGGQKNNADQAAARFSTKSENKKITTGMTDSERTEILRNKVIVAPVYKGQAGEAVNRERSNLESKKRSIVELALVRIADEFGAYTENKEKYRNADLQLSVSFSKSSIRESVHKEITDATQLAKLIPILKESIETAIGIESHDNRYYYDFTTANYHELLGGYIDGDYFVPIRFGLKELKDGNTILHVVVSQEKIKTEVMGTEYMKNFRGHPASRSVNFTVSQIIPFVNTADLLRYIPDGLLTESQKKLKYNEIANTIHYTNQKNDRKYMEALSKGHIVAAQKMVDEAARKAGYIIKAYHGTPNGTFNVFKDWQYFTLSKQYADRYQNQGASSNGYKTTANNPRTYEVFISADNVFDTRKAEHRKIFMDEFYQKWGNGAPLSERGLPDWTDGDDLIEFFEEKGYNFDAFYLDEGGTGGYGEEVSDRGISIVVHKSNQIKSADMITYDENGRVIPISERFNKQKNDIRYSFKQTGKVSAEKLSELKKERAEIAEEYRELKARIDEMKGSAEYLAFYNEVRALRKGGSRFGGIEAIKEIRSRQKQWADVNGLSEIEERYHDISDKLHDYDLKIYKIDKELKEKATAKLTEKVKGFNADEVSEYTSRAAEKFGITKKFDNAGYMLPDGALLDFSDGQGYRVLDHREIKDVLDFLPDNGNRSDGLIQFMNMGNIRMQISGIDISKAPTKSQTSSLKHFFDYNNGEITVDFSKENGDNAGSVEYPAGTSSFKILNDIKTYFENGTLPQISTTAAFHSMLSAKQTSPIQAHYAEVIRENRNFKQIISLLDEMQYSSVRGNVELNSKDINRIARDILKTTNSKYDLRKFENELTVLYDYLANGGQNANIEEAYSGILNIANTILEESEMKDTELFEQYKDVREFLRYQKIYITPAVKKEIESQFGSYKSFRNILMGKVMRLTTTDSTARTLDEVWQELAEIAPEYFPIDLNELDMPMQIAAFYEAIAPKVVNPFEHFDENIEDAAAELATDIMQKYFEVGRLKSPQEKYRNLVFDNMRKLEESKKALRREFKEKAIEDEQRLFEGYRQRVADYKQQRENSDRHRRLKNELDRNYNYLNRRLVRENDNDHIPENFKPLVSAFRFIIPDGNSYFSKSKFTDFENEYKELENISTFFDESILQRITALKERLTPGIGAPKMRELDNYELEELRNISEHIKYIVQNENKLFSDRLKGRIEDFANAVHDELGGKRDSKAQGVPKEKAGIADRINNSVDSFTKGLTKPEYLFSSLGSGTLKELYNELRRGENTEAKIIDDAKLAEQEIKKKYNYDPRWKNRDITIDFRSGPLTVTVEQAMALYATSKRKQGLEHMLNGGVTLYSLKKVVKNNKETETRVVHGRHTFNETDIPVLHNALTTEQKKYVDAMVEYITNDIGAKRNNVSIKLYGIEKYKEKYYFPIKVDRQYVDTNIGRQEVVATIKNQSSSKRTVEKAKNPIEVTGFTETVNRHIYDSALYCAYVLPINDFKRVYNFRDTVFEGEGVESLIRRDLSIKEDIRRTNGVNAIKQIEDFMKALDSGSRAENIIPISAKLAANAKKTAVMANLSVVVQQPTAVFRAMLYVNPKYFTTWAKEADIEEMKKWNGCALKKEIGYFDVNMGRTALDYLDEYSPEKGIKKEWSVGDYLKSGKITKAVDEVAGWGASKADEMTWGAIWKACKKQIKAENPALTGDALNAEAAELFQEVISKTQVYDSVFTKPDYMRRKDGFSMMATQFMSEPITSLNMLAEAIVNAKNAKGTTQQKAARKFCARAFGCYMTSVVVNSALKSVIYSMRGGDDDETFLERYVANVIENIATEPFGMIPYISDIFSVFQGYDLNRIDVAVFSTFKKAFDTLKDDEKSIYEKIMSVIRAAGQASGIPAYNAIRDGKSIIDIVKKIADGVKNGFEPTTGKGMLNELRETFDYLPGVAPTGDYEQLYASIIDGDKKHYNRIYNRLIASGKDESTIESGIASLFYENDVRIAEIYNAMEKGNIAEASRIKADIKASGFSDATINKALEKHKNELKKSIAQDERIVAAAEARYNLDYDEYERIIDELIAEGNSEVIVKDAVNSAKIELETKSDEFGINEKDTYTASYDLKNAMINGDASDVRKVRIKLIKELDKEKADSEIRKYAKAAYKSGDITEGQARQYLNTYRADGADDNDVFWDMEELKGGDDYRKYGKLYDSIDNSRNISGVIGYYTEHGVELKDIKSNITSEYKPILTQMTPGTAEYNAMREKIIDAFVVAGDTEKQAEKKVNKWAE